MKSRHLSVVVNASPEAVYGFAAEPDNLPAWASGLASADVRREGDLLIWDNRCTLHAATEPLTDKYKRDLRRATVNEYGPEMSAEYGRGLPPEYVRPATANVA